MSLGVVDLAWGHPVAGGPFRQLFEGFSLSCADGQWVVVIGSNGSGKTTLLNLVAGALKPQAGRIEIDGRDVTRVSLHQRARQIGRVLQNPLDGTAPDLSIAENLRIAERRRHSPFGPRGLAGVHPSGSDRRRYKALLDDLGVPFADRLDTPMGRLSGGQRQTVSLVMATLSAPRLLLLDEHTAALDPAAEAIVLGLTDRLVREQGTTTLMVTHSLEQALAHGDRLVMLHDGAILRDWTAADRAGVTPDDLRSLYRAAGTPAPNDTDGV
jgi:putative ABC transport system ATP-binding protein